MNKLIILITIFLINNLFAQKIENEVLVRNVWATNAQAYSNDNFSIFAHRDVKNGVYIDIYDKAWNHKNEILIPLDNDEILDKSRNIIELVNNKVLITCYSMHREGSAKNFTSDWTFFIELDLNDFSTKIHRPFNNPDINNDIVSRVQNYYKDWKIFNNKFISLYESKGQIYTLIYDFKTEKLTFRAFGDLLDSKIIRSKIRLEENHINVLIALEDKAIICKLDNDLNVINSNSIEFNDKVEFFLDGIITEKNGTNFLLSIQAENYHNKEEYYYTPIVLKLKENASQHVELSQINYSSNYKTFPFEDFSALISENNSYALPNASVPKGTSISTFGGRIIRGIDLIKMDEDQQILSVTNYHLDKPYQSMGKVTFQRVGVTNGFGLDLLLGDKIIRYYVENDFNYLDNSVFNFKINPSLNTLFITNSIVFNGKNYLFYRFEQLKGKEKTKGNRFKLIVSEYNLD